MTAPRTRVPAVAAALAITGLLATACGGVPLGPSESERGTQSFGAVSRVEVKARAGTVQVRPGADGAAQVDRVLRWRANAKPQLTQELRGDVLYVEATCPNDGDCEAELVFTVPAASAVRADLGAGTVTVTGLAGAQDLSTDAGNVTGTGLGAVPVIAKTAAGNVDVGFASPPPTVNAESSAGNVSVRVPTGPVYDVDATSSVGNARVEVPHMPGADHRITAKSSAGNVSVVPG